MPFEQAFFDVYGKRRMPADEGFAAVRDLLDAYEGVATGHPYFSGAGPCTMLIEEVEAIWAPIAADDDWSAFEAKLADIEGMRAAYGG